MIRCVRHATGLLLRRTFLAGGLFLYDFLSCRGAATSARSGCLVGGNEFLHGDSFDGLPNDFQWHVLQFAESDARLAHIQFLAGLLPGITKPNGLHLITVVAEQIHRDMVLL